MGKQARRSSDGGKKDGEGGAITQPPFSLPFFPGGGKGGKRKGKSRGWRIFVPRGSLEEGRKEEKAMAVTNSRLWNWNRK